MRRMRNNNLKIRIVGSSYRTQLLFFFISSVEIDFEMECPNLLFRQRRWLTLHFDDVIILHRFHFVFKGNDKKNITKIQLSTEKNDPHKITYPLSWVIVFTNSSEIRANFVLSWTWLVVRSCTFVSRFTKFWLCIHMSSVRIPVNNVCDILPVHYRGINGYFADESDPCSLFIFMCNTGADQVASRKLHRWSWTKV